LVTYKCRGEIRAGAWLAEGIVDLNRGYQHFLVKSRTPRAEARAAALVPSTMLELLRGESESLTAAKETIEYVKKLLAQGRSHELKHAGVMFSHEEVQLAAPVPNPPQILAVGLNYRAHAEETGNEIPQYPNVFTKEGKVIGPGEPIIIPPLVQQPDYEVELAFIMSKPATRVSKEAALDYVAGYATFNDVSARDIQSRVSQWTLGKSPDTFSVMGPYLVLSDEIPDPQTLRLTTRIEDKILQDSNTADMIFTVADIVAYVSQFMTLEPGTVVTTGTPSGVGARQTPPRFLRPGDTVTVEVEKLGSLSNPVQTAK
jgi:2-keto-4-pentenoate hydratase/2-oxohepta-3-ene-1,7-dioic acid hydratase in catechol pathway